MLISTTHRGLILLIELSIVPYYSELRRFALHLRGLSLRFKAWINGLIEERRSGFCCLTCKEDRTVSRFGVDKASTCLSKSHDVSGDYYS